MVIFNQRMPYSRCLCTCSGVRTFIAVLCGSIGLPVHPYIFLSHMTRTTCCILQVLFSVRTQRV
jgi:hypothetical protein